MPSGADIFYSLACLHAQDNFGRIATSQSTTLSYFICTLFNVP